METSLEEANRRLAADGYPPIRRLPADEAALAAWRRIVDAKRELERDGKLTDATLLAVSQFCHCLKCPTYARGEMPVYCLAGKTEHPVNALMCKCPTCAVYQVGGLHGTDYFCVTGVPERKLAAVGGPVGAAARLLAKEVEDGNPGKRLAERAMAPPQFVGRSQREVVPPEKVPGA